jgi:hypothetical protein
MVQNNHQVYARVNIVAPYTDTVPMALLKNKNNVYEWWIDSDTPVCTNFNGLTINEACRNITRHKLGYVKFHSTD